MNEMRTFALTLLLAFAGILGVIAAVNYVVDPYGIVGAGYAGFNRNKVEAIDHPDIAKTYRLERAKAKTILLGNSRVDLGLNPQSPHWPADARPAFNLAIPGYSMPTRAQYFEHALAVGRPTRLVMGFSIDDFWPSAPDAEPIARLRVDAAGKPNAGYWPARLNDLATSFLSLQTLSDSISTPLKQKRDDVSVMAEDGFNNGGALDARVRQTSAREFMEWKDRDKAPRLLAWAKTREIDFAPLERILAAAAKRNVEVTLFVTPSYVDDYLLFREAGLQADYDKWKRGLVALVDAARLRGVKVTLWDFSGVNERSTEALSGPGGPPLTWFWESQHFKPALGEEIIAALTGAKTGYGRVLTGADVEAAIAAHNANLDLFIKDHPADVARVREVLAELAPRKAAARAQAGNAS